MQQALSQPVSAARRNRRPWYDNERILGSLLLLPAGLYILLLVGVPFVLAILFSFTDVTTARTELHFVGLETFARVVQDPNFQHALLNTFIFTFVSQIIMLMLALTLALALMQNFRGKRIIRFLILLPWATPVALSTLGWWWMLNSVYTPFNPAMRVLGLIPVGSDMVWLGPGAVLGHSFPMEGSLPFWVGLNWSGVSILTVHIWRMLPMSTVIIMAGLTSIPQELRDAANVDGVNVLQELWYITLPLIRPISAVAFLFAVIFTFTDMAVVRVLTSGNNDTQVLASWAFFKGIEGGNLAEGAATAVFLVPVLFVMAVLMLRIARRSEVT